MLYAGQQLPCLLLFQHRVSGRKRPYLFLHPLSFDRLLRIPQDLLWFGIVLSQKPDVDSFQAQTSLSQCSASGLIRQNPRIEKVDALTFVPIKGLKCLSPELSKAPVTKHSEGQEKKKMLFLLENFEVLHNGLSFPKWKAKLVQN